MWDKEDVFGSLMKSLKLTGFLDEINLKNKLKTWTCLIVMILTICYFIMSLFITSEKEKDLAKLIEAIPTFLQVSTNKTGRIHSIKMLF